MVVKRLTPEEARSWRARSVERYRARRRAESPEKPPTSQSLRKTKADEEYRRNRGQRLVRARGRCEFWNYENPMFDPRCMAGATQTHHVMRRSHKVDHSVENLRALCASHHSWLHANVEWAKNNGWIVTEWRQIDAPATDGDGGK